MPAARTPTLDLRLEGQEMDDAVEKGYVDEATRFDMFKNDLVMVAGEVPELAAKLR